MTTASNGGLITLNNVMTYTNYAPRILAPAGGTACVTTRIGSMNHFEIRVSQQRLDIYGSDYSTDGQSFPNFRRMYSADLNLPFTRGYVHVAVRNHATIKYGFGPDGIYHWDNIGFDGPVISGQRAYEIPDNTTAGTYNSQSIRNLWLHSCWTAPAGSRPASTIPSTVSARFNFRASTGAAWSPPD
jgi:hypothetical protein